VCCSHVHSTSHHTGRSGRLPPDMLGCDQDREYCCQARPNLCAGSVALQRRWPASLSVVLCELIINWWVPTSALHIDISTLRKEQLLMHHPAAGRATHAMSRASHECRATPTGNMEHAAAHSALASLWLQAATLIGFRGPPAASSSSC
jgi:hypothetical protein